MMTSCFPAATMASTMERPTLPVPPATAIVNMMADVLKVESMM